MIDGIQPDTVLNVGQIMADTLSLDWCRDRKEIIGYINKYREYLHLMYPDEKLFSNRFYCIEQECFPEDCKSCCSCAGDKYYGVTIPDDIDGILEVWEDHEPLRTYSKWWEGRVGIATVDRPRTTMSATLVHQQFPTRRPMQIPSILSLYANNKEDENKVVTLKVDTILGVNKEIKATLRGDGVVKTKEVVKAIHSIILPNLCGTVTLLDSNNYELSEYNNYENVPSYRRLKISTPCNSGKIMIHGTQKFKPVWYDHDIVEVGSRLIVEAAARMFRYGENGTEADEINRSQLDEDKMKKLLRGALERRRGQSKQDGNMFHRQKLSSSPSLPGYSNSNRRYLNNHRNSNFFGKR